MLSQMQSTLISTIVRQWHVFNDGQKNYVHTQLDYVLSKKRAVILLDGALYFYDAKRNRVRVGVVKD